MNRRPPARPPEGWHERAYAAEDALPGLGIDDRVWTDYPRVLISLETLERLIEAAKTGDGR